ncbi:MAG TPA: hypothetical protein VEW25_07855 [Allosphingosinicella sp.]|nr:hypothetical protein [Allosphingosinicella sp.]
MRPDDQTYYSELEAGARYLAEGAGTAAEGDAHRAFADLYARRRADAAAWER